VAGVENRRDEPRADQSRMPVARLRPRLVAG
jgi:hypothetical protein